jgi:hypothetical protein
LRGVPLIRFIRDIPRNAALLLVLLLLIVVSPSIPEGNSGVLFELVFDSILIAGVYSVGPGRHRWPFLLVTVVTLAVRWGELLSGGPQLDVGALLITMLWLIYAVSIIIGHLFQRRDVTVDALLGAVVTYLLAAVAFTFAFEIVELLQPGSFSGIPDQARSHRAELGSSMLYFSFVCITTMGYGDIVPVSGIARPLAVLEGVFGQLYLAVMIARLVGLHIASSHKQED